MFADTSVYSGHFDKYCWNCNVGISPPAPGAMLKCDCNNDDGTTFYAWVEIGDHGMYFSPRIFVVWRGVMKADRFLLQLSIPSPSSLTARAA